MQRNRGYQVHLRPLTGEGAGQPAPQVPSQFLLPVELDPVNRFPQGAVVDSRGATAIERTVSPAAIFAQVGGRRRRMLEGEYRLPTAPAAGALETPERAPTGKADSAFVKGGKGAPADQTVGREERGGERK